MKHQIVWIWCFQKINWYIKDNNWSNYLTLIPIDENKDMLKNLKRIME